MKNKKGFTLVELMVVVAIIAILAAVALPMYSSFKQKSKVSSGIKGLTGMQAALVDLYQVYSTFDLTCTLTDDGSGSGAMIAQYTNPRNAQITNIGSAISGVPYLTWTLTTANATDFVVDGTFAAGSGCPETICHITWTMRCDADTNICNVEGVVGTDGNDTLGLGFGNI